MVFWSLFEVAAMPILQVLLISLLGAFMATGYSNLLHASARNSLNKIVFVVFTPSLVFASLAKTVTLQDIISWWYMPINIGLTFLFGGILGWILVKILRPKQHLEGLIIAFCSSGNLGNILLIIIPAICNEDGSPFGDHKTCSSTGLSYVSFSMALGGFYLWTYTYQLIKTSSEKHKALGDANHGILNPPNKDLDANVRTNFLDHEDQPSVENIVDNFIQAHESKRIIDKQQVSKWIKVKGILGQILEELLAPPTLAAILGFVFGATDWLRNLLIGESAPLRVIQDSIKLLGDGTIPCIILILGGNLTQGLRASKVKPLAIIGVVLIRYIILPLIGILIVKAADKFGFLPPDPLYRYVLLIQFTLPPAMTIGTVTQLFDVAQEECSVIFMWAYLAAAVALALWSTVYMWILS